MYGSQQAGDFEKPGEIAYQVLALFGRKPKIISAIFVDKDEEKSLKRRKGIELPQRRFGLIALEKGFIKADQLY